MGIRFYDWGAIAGDVKNLDNGTYDLDTISAMIVVAKEQDHVLVPTIIRLANDESKTIVNNANWSLSTLIHTEFTEEPLPTRKGKPYRFLRVQAPFGPLIFMNKNVVEKLAPCQLPESEYDGDCIAIGLKAYFSGVKVYSVSDIFINEARSTIYYRSIHNDYFIHTAYFEDMTFEALFKEEFMRTVIGIDGEVKEKELFLCLSSNQEENLKLIKMQVKVDSEKSWMKEHRVVQEEIFFRKAIWKEPEVALTLDTDLGLAKPSGQAAYVAYQAKRSPGRDWYPDKKRQRRDVNSFLEFLDEEGYLEREDLPLLDIGSRDGYVLNYLMECGFEYNTIHGIELSPWSAKWAYDNGRPVEQGDAHDLSRYEDNTFRAVTEFHNLEHCHDPVQVLSEVKRVLKSGGYAMIVVPIEFKGGISFKGDHCHTMQCCSDVLNLFEKANFNVVKSYMLGKDFAVIAEK